MVRKVILAVIAVFVAVFVGVLGTVAAQVASLGNGKAQAADGRPTRPPTTTFDETEYSIVTPAGWTREDYTAHADAEKAVRYAHADGSYFIVAMDPLGSDFAPDTVWTYRVAGTSFEIVGKQPCTTRDELCPDKDDRYDGYIIWKTGSTPKKLGGHVYYFMFGNSMKPWVDTAVFEQIIESISVKA
jgi:hypothetical protein